MGSEAEQIIDWIGRIEQELAGQYIDTFFGESTYCIDGEEYSAQDIRKVRAAIQNLRQMAENGAWKHEHTSPE